MKRFMKQRILSHYKNGTRSIHSHLLKPVKIPVQQHVVVVAPRIQVTQRRTFTAAATTTSTKIHAKPSSNSIAEGKTIGDVFLDNLGKVFLSAIALIIGALTRSSFATSNRNNLRTEIEQRSALDPFEIDDLRLANEDLDRDIFLQIMDGIEKKFGSLDGAGEGVQVDYREFISVVMNIMKGIKGEGFTIQLGHLLDRVVISILETTRADSTPDEAKIDLSLLLVVLSLCLNSTVRDRVEILFEVMERQQNSAVAQTNASATVKKHNIIEMIGHLQKTNQLVPDAQIVESETRYPVQKYRVGSPVELTEQGTVMKKDELSEDAMKHDIDQSEWTCDDFHHLLRSRAVCAWGECYVKKKGL